MEPSHPSSRAVRDLLRALITAHGALNPIQRPCGATISTQHAWALLELLGSGPLSVTDLSTRLNIDRTNVSRLCKRMESFGEVERATNPNDKRSFLFALTDKGTRAAHHIDRASTEHFDSVIARFCLEPQAVESALQDLIQALHSPPAPTSTGTPSP